MQFFRHEPPQVKASVVAIGSFDGLHLGHQAIIGSLKEMSENFQMPAWVLTFSPSPRAFFGTMAHGQLLSRKEKVRTLKALGVDGIWMPPFNAHWAQMTALDFVDKIMIKGLGAKVVVVGEDFRFGKGRQGDDKAFEAGAVQVVHPSQVAIDGEPVSSSRIRQALYAGDFGLVEKMLGRPYTLTGRVSFGDKRGRQMGFPTANVVMRFEPPLSGVFTVQATWQGETIRGIANLGVRPTFGGTKRICEAHFFDFEQNLYGQSLTLQFLDKIRDEKKFISVDVLVRQIKEDVKIAKQLLSSKL